jgi:AAA domain
MPTAAEILAELESQMFSLEETSPYFKGLLYGPSGGGKTVEALEIAQAITPPDREIIYIDSYEGWVSLQNHPHLKKRVRRIRWQNWTQANTLLDAILANAGSFTNIGCLVWDEFSTMAERDLDTVTTNYAVKDRSKDPDISTWPDMNASSTRMRRLYDKMLTIEANLVIVAHQRKDQDARKVEVTSPNFLPKFGVKMLEPMHLVGYMTADQSTAPDGTAIYKREIQVHPTRLITAKSRVGGLPVVVDPIQLVQAIVEWLMGTRDSEPDRIPDLVIPPVGSVSETDDAIVVE